MVLSVNITPDIERAIQDTAQRHGQTPEETVTSVLESVFIKRTLPADLPVESDAQAAHFLAAAEATRPVWDTPEEDAAWAHLQTLDVEAQS